MTITVAATQFACTQDKSANLKKLEASIRKAAAQGAKIIVPQELPSHPFFQNFAFDTTLFALAETRTDSAVVRLVSGLAKELGVVIPANFYERAGQAYFNTLVMYDADGRELGIYRKTHMPLGPPSCFEKYYTSPGDTGFTVFPTHYGVVGAGICWDQWFPEAARIMALKGADLLIYPTAIGSDCLDHWKAAMCGHSASNIMPVIAANRVGTEEFTNHTTQFWGHSFITDQCGKVIAEADDQEAVITAEIDPDANRQARADWGMFRDRRPDLYRALLSMTGEA